MSGHLGFDESWASAYRLLDQGTGDDAIDHYGALLTQLSTSLGRQIDVLDIGCGTGRYFHRLRNVRRLVGMDPSPYMLEQARSPVSADRIRAESIELICGELQSASFPDATFDLIYSIGVVGEYAPIDAPFLRRCRALLRDGGVLLVTAVDSQSRVAVPEDERPSFLRRAARKAWPRLPAWLRVSSNRWLSPCYVERPRLERLFASSGFPHWEIHPYQHPSGWIGTHFDCIAAEER